MEGPVIFGETDVCVEFSIPINLSEWNAVRLCNRSDRLLLQSVSGCKASIFVRKTLQVLPCEIKKL